MERQAGAMPLQGQASGTGLPLSTLQQFVAQSMPVAAVAHSYHVDALSDPTLRSDARFQQFSLAELNELHHQVALLGNLIRLSQGDQTAAAGLGLNLSGFLQNRMIGLQLAGQLPAAAMQHPSVQRLMALTEMSNQQVTQYLPAIQQTLAATGARLPGMLVAGIAP
ncbi:MAG TPA: hypothetical protein VD969_27010 [Symbiobacteriaceae bacterium]|nr:hypothetical protein [Symbiobacteriaceae bacterium]